MSAPNEVEYPDGLSRIEMVLIEMLTEYRSWDHRLKIAEALITIRDHAHNLKMEKGRNSAREFQEQVKNEVGYAR